MCIQCFETAIILYSTRYNCQCIYLSFGSPPTPADHHQPTHPTSRLIYPANMQSPNKTDNDPDKTTEFSNWSTWTPVIDPPAPSEMNTTNPKVERHPEYYFDIVIFLVRDTHRSGQDDSPIGGMMHQVENQLFRVPRRNFATQSDIFSDMFQLPLPEGDGASPEPEGLTDDRPIRLDGISRSSFILLLRVMFPL